MSFTVRSVVPLFFMFDLTPLHVGGPELKFIAK